MKKLFSFLMLSLLICSCESDGTNKQNNSQGTDNSDGGNLAISISSMFAFIPTDSYGNNLLQIDNPLTIDDFDIVFYDDKGKPYYYIPGYMNPDGRINPERIWIGRGMPEDWKDTYGDAWNGDDWLVVDLNGPNNDYTNIGTTYLRILDKVYKIDGEWEESWTESENGNDIGGYSFEVGKIWFDGELVYDPDVYIGLIKITIK